MCVSIAGDWSSSNSSLTISRGSCRALGLACSPEPPLYRHALVPSGFRRQVRRLTQKHSSRLPLSETGIQLAVLHGARFPASGSSLCRVVRGTEDTAPATTCASIPGHARWSVRCQASSNFSNGCCRSVASLPPRPVGSLHPFGLGMSRSRRPYLPHYKTAFAFSDSPLPPPSSPFLAVGIPPCGGTSGAYPVVQCGDADGPAASYSPAGHGVTVDDDGNRRSDPRAILAPTCQHFWPVLDHGP
jgi:hypothetical protein